MEIRTVEYKVYKYNELSDKAKEKVKEWYLDGQNNLSYIFTEDCKMDLENLFGENDLKVQYSLAGCQGDGFNIYGKIDVKSIFKCLENKSFPIKDMLTDKEKKTILHYAEHCCDIVLPLNTHYCYCMADYIYIASNWYYDLTDAYFKNIDLKVLEKFEDIVQEIFKNLCNDFENRGYKFFYEISEEDLEEVCELNEYEFLEDGTLF